MLQTLNRNKELTIKYSNVTEEEQVLDMISFSNLAVGDEVPFEDGTYYDSQYEYRIKDGVVQNIFNALVDHNQLNMDEILFPIGM